MVILLIEFLIKLVEYIKIPILDSFVKRSEICLVRFSRYEIKKNAVYLNERYYARLSYLFILSFFVLPIFKNTIFDDFFFWITAIILCIFLISSSCKEHYDKDFESSNCSWITKSYEILILTTLILSPLIFLYFVKIQGLALGIFLVVYIVVSVSLILMYKYGNSILWVGVFKSTSILQQLIQFVVRHRKKGVVIVLIYSLVFILKFFKIWNT